MLCFVSFIFYKIDTLFRFYFSYFFNMVFFMSLKISKTQLYIYKKTQDVRNFEMTKCWMENTNKKNLKPSI